MSKKSIRSATRPQSIAQQAAADCINRALEKSDIAEICHAIAAATRLYNISDLAQKSGLSRPSIHVRLQVIKKTKPRVFNVLGCRRCADRAAIHLDPVHRRRYVARSNIAVRVTVQAVGNLQR